MKYIKDESGNIYKGLFIDRIFWNPHGWSFAMDDNGEPFSYREKKIVAQSDNLEDLCDLIVFETAKEVYAFPVKKRDLWEKQIKGIKRRFLATYESKIEIVAKWDGKEWELI